MGILYYSPPNLVLQRFLTLFIGCLFLLLARPTAASFFDPSPRYLTSQTPHFRIHYAENLSEMAQQVAGHAEAAHRLLGEHFKVYPKGRVQILLTDQSDSANGFATVLPYNLMILRVTPPEADRHLAHYDDWLKLLTFHEYTHIVNLSDAGYPAKAFKVLFGKLVAPNALSPQWVMEGIATYFETALTEAGRGRSGQTEMLLRTDILNKQFLKIDEAAGTIYDWPSHQAPYLYGVAFWNYLASQYGPEKITKFSNKYGASLWFFSLNNKAKRVFGKSFYKLWREWKQHLTEQYQPLKESLAAKGLKIGELYLGKKKEYFTHPTISPDGTQVAYIASSPHYKTQVRLKNTEGDRLLFDNYEPSNLSFSPDGKKLAFTALSTYKRYYYYYDLFLYDLESKKFEVLTEGQRVRDASFSPDGQQIAVSLHEVDRDRLAVYNLADKELTKLNQPQAETRIDHLSWSPDGTMIAASVWATHEHRNIFIYKPNGQILKRITRDTAVDYHPLWSPDSQKLYFSSDRNGIFNIYQYNLRNGKLLQVTRVLSGAFRPALAGEELIYQYYTGRGFELRRLAISPFSPDERVPMVSVLATGGAGKPLDTAERKARLAKGLDSDRTRRHQATYSTQSYSPWSTALLPHYVQPNAAFLDNAVFLSALIGSSDPLFRHSWSLVGTYRTDANYFGASGVYSYTRWRPNFSLGYSMYAVNFGNLVGTGSDFFEERKRGFAGVSYPLPKNQSIAGYYFFENRSAETAIPAAPLVNPILGNYAGLSLYYNWNKHRQVPAAISPEESYYLRASASFTDKVLGSSPAMEQTIFTADARQFIELPWGRHHVLALRQVGGVAFGDQLTQGNFAVGGSIGEGILTGTSNRTFTLRGLPLTTFLRDRALVLSAEYRMPLFSLQRGLGTLPLAVNQTSIAFFADFGNAWNNTPAFKDLIADFLLGVGVELRAEFVIGYHLPLTGRLGYGIIVLNRDRVANIGLTDPFFGQDIANGIVILEFGTSF